MDLRLPWSPGSVSGRDRRVEGRARAGVAAIAALLFVSLAAVPAAGHDVCEEPATPDGAPMLVLPAACHGELSYDDEIDRFSIELQRGQHLGARVRSLPDLYWTGLRFVDPTGSIRACVEGTALDACDLRADIAGTWILEVVREVGQGAYLLALATTDAQDDCEDGADAPDTLEGAPELFLTTSAPGVRERHCEDERFDALDERDVFTFRIVSGVQVQITINAPQGVVGDAELRDPTGFTAGRGNTAIASQASVSGLWSLVVIRGHIGASGLRYAFAITTIQDDCGSGVDVGADEPYQLVEPWQAKQPGARSCSGVVDPLPIAAGATEAADRVDVFAFTRSGLAVPSQIELRAPAATCVDLVTSSGEERVCDGDLVVAKVGSAEVERFEVAHRSGAGGAYALHVWGIVPMPADCGTPGDAGATPETAKVLAGEAAPTHPPSVVMSCGAQSRAQDIDLFVVRAPARSAIEVSAVAEDGSSLAVCVIDVEGVCAGSTDVVDVERDVFLRVGPSGAPTSYELAARLLLQDDCGTGADAADAGPPTPVSKDACTAKVPQQARQPLSGQVQPPVDLVDRYGFEVLNDIAALTVTLEPGSTTLDVDLCVRAPSGAVACASAQPGVPEVVTVSSCTATQGEDPACRGLGMWTVEVSWVAGPIGTYELLVARRPEV